MVSTSKKTTATFAENDAETREYISKNVVNICIWVGLNFVLNCGIFSIYFYFEV